MSQATAEQTAGTPAAEAPAHLRASHRELTDALNLAALAVPPRPPVPTMGGIVVHAQGRGVTLRAYDYEAAVSVSLPADAGATERSVLDYGELTKTLAAAVAGETKAATAGTVVTVDGDQVSTSQVSVPVTVHPLEEYPSLPPAAPPVATVDGPEFFRQLARVLPAAGKDDTQPVLTMVGLTLTGRLGSLRRRAGAGPWGLRTSQLT
jgi:DNA polymerase-3 subunit beta